MDWQLTVTVVIVLFAGGYLVWRGWRLYSRKKSAGCGSCSADGAKKETVVGISVDRISGSSTEGHKR
jgi:hypothetical protein